VADIEYRDITSDGLLRASLFKGLTKGTRRLLPDDVGS
jgi:bifunctional non-homologous end joining protein LigD